MIQEVTKAETRSDALMEFLTFVLSILISVLKPINTLMDAFILAVSLQIVRGI
jgi:hypothetical protein